MVRTPDILLLSQFSSPSGDYLKYIKRLEAIQSEHETKINLKDFERFLRNPTFSLEEKREVQKIIHSHTFFANEFAIKNYLRYVARAKAIQKKSPAEKETQLNELQEKISLLEEMNVVREDSFSFQQNLSKDNQELTGLFTETSDNLTQEEYEKYEKFWTVAQKNQSIMYQDVLSFSEEFARKAGLKKIRRYD